MILVTVSAGDFPVVATGMDISTAAVENRFDTYVNTLCEEISLHAAINSEPLQTVSFGGGTPSLIPPHLLSTILSCVERTFGIAADAEISMEADPGTFDVHRLREYMQLGVNRFSMGVQAFEEVRSMRSGSLWVACEYACTHIFSISVMFLLVCPHLREVRD